LNCRKRGESGQALVEFLIVVPILLLIFFGIVEVGAAWRTFQVITNTAREGARASVLPNATEAGVRAIVIGRLDSAGLDASEATVDIVCLAGPGACFPSQSGGSTEVRIAFPHTFILLGPLVELATGGGGDQWGEITMRTGIVRRNE
jgi:Flp pilus assembly protein TadG